MLLGKRKKEGVREDELYRKWSCLQEVAYLPMEGFEHVRRVSVRGFAFLVHQGRLGVPSAWVESCPEEALCQGWLHPCQNLQSLEELILQGLPGHLLPCRETFRETDLHIFDRDVLNKGVPLASLSS